MAARSSSRASIPSASSDSAEILDFEIPYSRRRARRGQGRWSLKANGLHNCYVRPVAWRGSEMMAVAAQNSTIHVAIAVWDWPSMFDIATKMKGIKLDIAEYRRPDPQTAPCAWRRPPAST